MLFISVQFSKISAALILIVNNMFTASLFNITLQNFSVNTFFKKNLIYYLAGFINKHISVYINRNIAI